MYKGAFTDTRQCDYLYKSYWPAINAIKNLLACVNQSDFSMMSYQSNVYCLIPVVKVISNVF